jgi:hypothetical protein
MTRYAVLDPGALHSFQWVPLLSARKLCMKGAACLLIN